MTSLDGAEANNLYRHPAFGGERKPHKGYERKDSATRNLMPTTSQFARPVEPIPMVLQPRDRAVLRSLYEHRYLTSDHVRLLHYAGRTASPVRVRLRKLWSNEFVDRRFMSVVFDGTTPTSLRPLYALARKGAQVVVEQTGRALREIPHTPTDNAVGFSTLEHNLVVTDLLVSLSAACAGRRDLELASFLREPALRAALARGHRRNHRIPAVIADGAFTLASSAGNLTFHVEVVRAGVKQGNETLVRKLERYARLRHEGFFERALGQRRLRAVLIATTSRERTENLRRLAARRLQHGRRLFWFGAYPLVPSANLPATTFTPETVLEPMWVDTEGRTFSLIQPDAC